MSRHGDDVFIGRPWPAWLFAALTLGVLISVAWFRGAGIEIPQESAPVNWRRLLRCEDRPNGDIAVIDAATRREVAHYTGEQGFVRGTLRALARERKRRDLDDQPPFELTGHQDGRLTLRDTATGQRINLESFGPTNLAVFAQLQYAAATQAGPHKE